MKWPLFYFFFMLLTTGLVLCGGIPPEKDKQNHSYPPAEEPTLLLPALLALTIPHPSFESFHTKNEEGQPMKASTVNEHFRWRYVQEYIAAEAYAPGYPAELEHLWHRTLYSLYVKGNLTETVSRAMEAAALGSPKAQWLLGGLYGNGVGVPRSEPLSLLHFTFAANSRSPPFLPAHLTLGYRYASGIGTKKQYRRAAHHLEVVGDALMLSYLHPLIAVLPPRSEATPELTEAYAKRQRRGGGAKQENHDASGSGGDAPTRGDGEPIRSTRQDLFVALLPLWEPYGLESSEVLRQWKIPRRNEWASFPPLVWLGRVKEWLAWFLPGWVGSGEQKGAGEGEKRFNHDKDEEANQDRIWKERVTYAEERHEGSVLLAYGYRELRKCISASVRLRKPSLGGEEDRLAGRNARNTTSLRRAEEHWENAQRAFLRALKWGTKGANGAMGMLHVAAPHKFFFLENYRQNDGSSDSAILGDAGAASIEKAFQYFKHGLEDAGDTVSSNGMGFLHVIGAVRRNHLVWEVPSHSPNPTPASSRPLSTLFSPDYITALKHFRIGASQGSEEALYNLGLCHALGFGGPPSVSIAREELLQVSLLRRHPLALWQLANVESREVDAVVRSQKGVSPSERDRFYQIIWVLRQAMIASSWFHPILRYPLQVNVEDLLQGIEVPPSPPPTAWLPLGSKAWGRSVLPLPALWWPPKAAKKEEAGVVKPNDAPERGRYLSGDAFARRFDESVLPRVRELPAHLQAAWIRKGEGRRDLSSTSLDASNHTEPNEGTRWRTAEEREDQAAPDWIRFQVSLRQQPDHLEEIRFSPLSEVAVEEAERLAERLRFPEQALEDDSHAEDDGIGEEAMPGAGGEVGSEWNWSRWVEALMHVETGFSVSLLPLVESSFLHEVACRGTKRQPKGSSPSCARQTGEEDAIGRGGKSEAFMLRRLRFQQKGMQQEEGEPGEEQLLMWSYLEGAGIREESVSAASPSRMPLSTGDKVDASKGQPGSSRRLWMTHREAVEHLHFRLLSRTVFFAPATWPSPIRAIRRIRQHSSFASTRSLQVSLSDVQSTVVPHDVLLRLARFYRTTPSALLGQSVLQALEVYRMIELESRFLLEMTPATVRGLAELAWAYQTGEGSALLVPRLIDAVRRGDRGVAAGREVSEVRAETRKHRTASSFLPDSYAQARARWLTLPDEAHDAALLHHSERVRWYRLFSLQFIEALPLSLRVSLVSEDDNGGSADDSVAEWYDVFDLPAAKKYYEAAITAEKYRYEMQRIGYDFSSSSMFASLQSFNAPLQKMLKSLQWQWAYIHYSYRYYGFWGRWGLSMPSRPTGFTSRLQDCRCLRINDVTQVLSQSFTGNSCGPYADLCTRGLWRKKTEWEDDQAEEILEQQRLRKASPKAFPLLQFYLKIFWTEKQRWREDETMAWNAVLRGASPPVEKEGWRCIFRYFSGWEVIILLYAVVLLIILVLFRLFGPFFLPLGRPAV